MTIDLKKSGNEWTATAYKNGYYLASATTKSRQQARIDATKLGQQVLTEAKLPAEPAVVVAPLPGKRLVPEFSAGPLPFAELVQQLRAVTRLR